MTDRLRSIAEVIRFPTAPIGAFAEVWEGYAAVGIAAYPKDAAGKKPAVKASRRRPGAATLREWATERFRGAGIIVRTGRISDLTVIDVDAHGNRDRVPDLVRLIEERCGSTPIKVSTPSGGVHLWYRHNGERNRAPHGEKRDRLPVDVRGEDGWSVVPPTVTEKGEYRFLAGELADVPRLPKINPGALAELYGDVEAKTPAQGTLRDGDGRNSALYPLLCEAALDAVSEELFYREAERLNAAMCADLLPAAELKKAVAGIWQRKLGKGRPLYRSVAEPYALVTMTDWQRHGFDPYNIGLLTMARLLHKPGKRFALNARGMVRSPSFSGWARQRIEKAAAHLAGPGGAFRQVHKGGRGPGDAAQYVLLPVMAAALEQRGVAGLVPTGGTNRTNHPPPLSLTEATRTTRGPAREQARREGEPGRLSAASSFPSGLRAAPSAPGGSDPGTSVPAVMISSTRNHPSESVGAKISAADRPGDQLDLVEYLGGEARPAPPDPQEVRQWMFDLGLSQRAAAMLAGFSHYGSLSAWLAGRQGLSPENAARLRRAMTINSNVA